MPVPVEEPSPPDFEIDHQNIFGQFLMEDPREIAFYLDQLVKRHSILTAYINEGQEFFLTSIVAFDQAAETLFLDPSNALENNARAQVARQITLVTNLDRIKMQMRLPALEAGKYKGQVVLTAPIPKALLRLQRREFFRLEPPLATPLRCQLAAKGADGKALTLELALSDISGGGVSLISATELAQYFPRDALFQNCRLEIPGEGVIQVNLRVRKTFEISAHSGEHNLRVGCEFFNLPGTRLAFIERYIARIERERKARASGLAD